MAVLKRLAALLAPGRDGHRSAHPPHPSVQPLAQPAPVRRCERREPRLTRLDLPNTLVATLGCDAVGLPARYGMRLLGRLPRGGCVFADSDWWWWIVPAGSDLGLLWPLPAHYAPGARVPAIAPRLIRSPEGDSPYTPPIPLYLMTCQLTGMLPRWPVGVSGPVR
ncbi:hypothetical protein [Streptomyces sp. NPDC005805]|uniref:hypothetical protein n=1 Tax=Streptomyces sp. NPDC005805 TaxID=3157068 RepID=UPI0033C8F704